MKNNNLKIAEEYSLRMKAITDKCWIQDNLPDLTSGDRKAILKVYRKHFHTVEYDPDTGICKCWVTDPALESNKINPEDTVLESISIDTANADTRANHPVKQSTRDLLGLGEVKERHIWIDDSDQMPGTKH